MNPYGISLFVRPDRKRQGNFGEVFWQNPGPIILALHLRVALIEPFRYFLHLFDDQASTSKSRDDITNAMLPLVILWVS
jgi:hypothetical protein